MGRRRRQPNCLETSTELSELSVNLLQPSGGRAQDLREGQVEGDGELGRVQRAVEGGDGQVCDENKEKITFKISSPSVKPKNWKLVKKRGIIPDGLVQSKLKSFITKFPNLERGVKRNIHESSPVSRRGLQNGVQNGVPNEQ